MENTENLHTDEELKKMETPQEDLKEASEVPEVKEEENFKNRFYYLAAEMENFKKRAERDKEGLLKFGNERLLTDLVEVIDNFDRTLQALQNKSDPAVKNIVAGIEVVQKQFQGILQKHGLNAVESLGKIFDPNFHEAVAQKQVEGKKDQEIVEEYQKGYVLNGRLLRPAKVVVVTEA